MSSKIHVKLSKSISVRVSAYGLGLIFDVPTGNAKVLSQHSGSIRVNGHVHWLTDESQSTSSSQSLDSLSASDPEISQHQHRNLRIRQESDKSTHTSLFNVPDLSSETIGFLKAARSSLPPTTLLVARIGDTKTAVIFLSVASKPPVVLQKNALVSCLEELEQCGVNVAYVAVPKSHSGEQKMVTPLLKTLLFIGFEILADAPPDLASLSLDYRLLFTNLHE
ncbi:Fibrillin 2 [Schistosoma japonicum]|uniref:Fibrillin 2 n=1 Tax=Schistosoma japonicum TaxID=6182 RepID=A0A4Z2DBB7_SCHJA|nr:Fibrillin 2 [Schistosoma japonicum]